MTKQRPTDEETARVAAWQYKDEKAYKDFRVEYFEEVRQIISAVFCDRITGEKDILFSEDPRDDTDTAMEMLHHAMKQMKTKVAIDIHKGGESWVVFDWDNDSDIKELPISGAPFRYAVVNLALEIMENNK